MKVARATAANNQPDNRKNLVKATIDVVTKLGTPLLTEDLTESIYEEASAFAVSGTGAASKIDQVRVTSEERKKQQ